MQPLWPLNGFIEDCFSCVDIQKRKPYLRPRKHGAGGTDILIKGDEPNARP